MSLCNRLSVFLISSLFLLSQHESGNQLTIFSEYLIVILCELSAVFRRVMLYFFQVAYQILRMIENALLWGNDFHRREHRHDRFQFSIFAIPLIVLFIYWRRERYEEIGELPQLCDF